MPDDDREMIELDAVKTAQGSDALQLPPNMKPVGETEYGDVKVYIHQDVLRKITDFSSSDKTRELGGILVGDYGVVLGKETVLISGYIVAEHTDATAASLTFTHESWEQIHRERERNYPDKRIVGWHHTHPGYGIFLSSYDEFIHQNFFNLKWQIAMVVDPKSGETGLFEWKGDRLAKLEGYYLYDEPGKPLKVKAAGKTASTGGRGVRKLDIVLIALIVVLCGALFIYASGKTAVQAYTPPPAVTASPDGDGKQEIDALSTQYANLQGKYSELAGKYEAMQSQLKNLAESPALSPSPVATATRQYVPQTYFMYVVRHGDTLNGICGKFGIDYARYKNMILSVNGIADANKIRTGQALMLPVVK